MTNRWKVDDRVQLKGLVKIAGTVTSVSEKGNIGVKWDDGDVTEPGMIHPLDVDPATR